LFGGPESDNRQQPSKSSSVPQKSRVCRGCLLVFREPQFTLDIAVTLRKPLFRLTAFGQELRTLNREDTLVPAGHRQARAQERVDDILAMSWLTCGEENKTWCRSTCSYRSGPVAAAPWCAACPRSGTNSGRTRSSHSGRVQLLPYGNQLGSDKCGFLIVRGTCGSR